MIDRLVINRKILKCKFLVLNRITINGLDKNTIMLPFDYEIM